MISSVDLIPAVSIKVIGIPLISMVSVIASRVVPSISVTMALSSPKRALSSVDLPEPDGHMSAPLSPSFTVKFTFLRTLFCRLFTIYVLQRSFTLRIVFIIILLFLFLETLPLYQKSQKIFLLFLQTLYRLYPELFLNHQKK